MRAPHIVIAVIALLVIAATPSDADATGDILVCATKGTAPCTRLPLCPTEDSTACVWVSPRTGDAYLNPTTEEMDQ